MSNFQEKVNFIWGIADLLRGSYKAHEYQDIILPLTVIRRLDAVLEPSKEEVLKKVEELKENDVRDMEPVLKREFDLSFFNTSPFTFKRLTEDPNNLAENLKTYIRSFSPSAREILEHFDFEREIDRLNQDDLLYQIIEQFAEIDLHPDTVENHEMGTIFEELIRKFSEQSNETAGEHFTPREIIRLMVSLLLEGNGSLEKKDIIRQVYDPACGTGGMLTIAKDELLERNDTARVFMYGQELNPKTYAISKADMLIKGEEPDNIKLGNSFTDDQLDSVDDTFDYMLSNPPFGVSWKKSRKFIENEHDNQGYDGRFGPGTPRVSDGSLLFLLHMIDKMKPVDDGGSRIAIVFNGSPLFTGDAGSGESEIRRYILENDLLEAIVGLPEELFYNTGINTYIWILSNDKHKEREGNVQLIDAREMYKKMRKSLGNKRNKISADHIEEITDIYNQHEDSAVSKVFANEEFGFRKIRIERPLQLNFQASQERIDRLEAEKYFRKLAEPQADDPQEAQKEREADEKKQENIKEVLASMGDKLYKNQPAFLEDLETAFADSEIELTIKLKKAIKSALSERDESADIVEKSNGDPKPDTDLRDYERVPLGTDPKEYFKEEVLPHVPKAWISDSSTYVDDKDGELGRVGYEISFTRYFYEYEPPRDLEEIKSDIADLKKETEGLMEELFG